MPTKAECQELIGNTRQVWAVPGIEFFPTTGSSKYILLPAAGCYKEGSLFNVRSFGYYWNSILYGDSRYAWRLLLTEDEVEAYAVWFRYYAMSMRGVIP